MQQSLHTSRAEHCQEQTTAAAHDKGLWFYLQNPGLCVLRHIYILPLKFCEETVNVSFWYACSSLFTPQEQSIVILSIAQQAICRTVVFPDNHRRFCYAWTVWVIPISPIPSSHWDKSLCANQHAKTLLKKIASQDCTIEAPLRPVSAAAKPKIHQASSLWYVACQIQTSTEKNSKP